MIRIRTVIAAGCFVGLPLITSAPALAAPDSTVSCSFPCTVVEQTVVNYAELPGTVVQNYVAFPGDVVTNYATAPETIATNYQNFPNDVATNYGSFPHDVATNYANFPGEVISNYANFPGDVVQNLLPGLKTGDDEGSDTASSSASP